MVHRIVFSVAITLVAAGCGGEVADGDDTSSSDASSGAGSSTTGAGTPSEYVLDFTTSEKGGAFVGGNSNLAFSIKKETPRQYAFMSAGVTQVKPGAILSNDLTGCSNPSALEQAVGALERVDVANVDVVSIDVAHVGSQMDLFGQFCYGYRTAGGGWTWELQGKGWTYSSDTNSYHVDLILHQENVDAIKVISTSSARPVTTIKYSTF